MANPLLDVLSCYADTSNVHILEKPKVLPCLNKICEKCFRENLINGKYKCPFKNCKKEHEHETADTKTQELFEQNSEYLFRDFYAQIIKERDELESNKFLAYVISRGIEVGRILPF
jgi:hypothetical protein